jgi:hypothetical protein
VIVELLSVAAIFVGGCLLVRTAGLRGWGVLPFGLVAGVFLMCAVGLVQVTTALPTSPLLTLILTCGLPLAWWLVRLGQGHDVRIPVVYAVVTLATLAGTVVVFRAANLVKWHIDSFTYLTGGALLADGTHHIGVSPTHLTKRLIGLPVIHAPAQLAGETYLRSITPLLAAATLGILVWLFQRGLRDRLDRTMLLGFAGLAVLVLLTNNRFVFSAFYINGHLLTGIELLVIAGCGWLLLSRDHPALRLLQLLAIPALVVTRPEGSVLAVLALLPTLLAAQVRMRHRVLACVTLAAATLLWNAYMVWVFADRGEEISRAIYGDLAVGVAALVAIAALPWVDRLRRPAVLLWTAELGLWLVLAGFAARRPEILDESVRATVRNVVYPSSIWGSSLVVLGLLVLVAIAVGGADRLTAALRFPVTTFLPFAFLLAYLREEGAYRVGATDSLNRMFMHIVPLAVLYVVVAYARADWLGRWAALRSLVAAPAGQRRPEG